MLACMTHRFAFLPVLAALALLAALASTVLAAPGVQPAETERVGEHVDPADCDEMTVDGAAILVGGVALTADQVAALGPTDAVLELAASAAGESAGDVCLDVAGLPGTPTVNGHIHICGEVSTDPDALYVLTDVITVDGAQINDGIQTVDTVEALQAADLAGVDACFAVEVVDTQFFVEVAVPRFCASTTLRAGQTLDLVIGQNELSLGKVSVTQLQINDPEDVLQLDLAVGASLELVASADFELHGGEFIITVVGADTCKVAAALPNVATDRASLGVGQPMVLIGLVLIGGALILGGRRARVVARN
jgi:hypothetical protein